MSEKLYSSSFYENIDDGSRRSAYIVLSILREFIDASSAVDVGCGAGSWMRPLQDIFNLDESSVVGVDGDYSKRMHVNLPYRFHYGDLSKNIAVPDTYDLAISLEVAEHLPLDCASGFIRSLCGLSKVVLFSAATPNQGGTGHVNEQWADFWMKEFAKFGYKMFDPIRSRVWLDDRVESWYSQNCFLFVHIDQVDLINKLECYRIESGDWRLRVVHPAIFNMAACESCGAGRLLRAAPERIFSSIRRHLRHY